MLQSHSCDGTPMNTRRRTMETLPSGFKLRTSGRQSSEFLVKLQMVRSLDPSGTECSSAALFDEAAPLVYGKKVYCMAACC